MPHPAEPRLSSQMLLLSAGGKTINTALELGIFRLQAQLGGHGDYQAPKGEALNSSRHTCGAIEIQYRSAAS